MAKDYGKDTGAPLKNVYLTGFMCSGKTSSGAVLARLLGRPFADSDQVLARRYGVCAASLIRERGLGGFRRMEAAEVRRLARKRGLVVSLGGGVYPSSRWKGLLKRTGVTVFLDCPWKELAERLKAGRARRPLLDGRWEEALSRARALYDRRLPFYRLADIRIGTGGLTPARAAEKVKAALSRAEI